MRSSKSVKIRYDDLLEIEASVAQTLDVIRQIRRGTYYEKEGEK